MDTVVTRRLFSDPDFAMLARELKDPLRAAGALLFVWQGTQQKRLVIATDAELIACFPLGYRGAKTAITAMTKTGWLVDISEITCRYPADIPEISGRYPDRTDRGNSTIPKRYEVRGNVKHVTRKATLSEQNRRAAETRWKALNDASRMRDEQRAHASASPADASAMPPIPIPIPIPSLDLQQHAREADGQIDDSLPTKREIRPTRGFPETAFESEFRELGKAAGFVVGAFGDLEKSITGKILRRLTGDGITQRQLITEWWRSEWTDIFGWSIKQLDAHYLEVRAAIADQKARPKPRGRRGEEQKPAGYRGELKTVAQIAAENQQRWPTLTPEEQAEARAAWERGLAEHGIDS